MKNIEKKEVKKRGRKPKNQTKEVQINKEQSLSKMEKA